MSRPLLAIFLALALGLPSVSLASPHVDTSQVPDDNEACAHMVPEALRAQALKDHPGYRFLRVDDYSVDDIKSERQYHEGSKCLAAASGDYFGDGYRAYTFMLLSETSNLVTLIARQTPDKHWEIHILGGPAHVNYVKGQFNLFVNTLPPGTYSDAVLEEGDEPGETENNDPNWKGEITSKIPGIAIGMIESAETGYFLKDGHWIYTHVSD